MINAQKGRGIVAMGGWKGARDRHIERWSVHLDVTSKEMDTFYSVEVSRMRMPCRMYPALADVIMSGCVRCGRTW